jgi:hypothetical protein
MSSPPTTRPPTISEQSGFPPPRVTVHPPWRAPSSVPEPSEGRETKSREVFASGASEGSSELALTVDEERSAASTARGWGGVRPSRCGAVRSGRGAVPCGAVAVRCRAVLFPGGLKGRGALACSLVASATPIRAGGAESADMSLSDRERAEGFHRTITSGVSSPLTASERAEGIERTTAITVTTSGDTRIHPQNRFSVRTRYPRPVQPGRVRRRRRGVASV